MKTRLDLLRPLIAELITVPATITAMQTGSGMLTIENRTTDPSTPATGRIWLRTDL